RGAPLNPAPVTPEIDLPADQAPAQYSGGGRPSICAGLFYLIPAIEDIGLAGALATEPELIDLPARLLYAIALRLGASDADPPFLFLAGLVQSPSLPLTLPAPLSHRGRAGRIRWGATSPLSRQGGRGSLILPSLLVGEGPEERGIDDLATLRRRRVRRA